MLTICWLRAVRILFRTQQFLSNLPLIKVVAPLNEEHVWWLWGWVCFLLYRVFLVQLVPARIVSAQPAPHPLLPRVLRQTLSRCRRLCVITPEWWEVGRDWKSALQSAHLPGFARLNSGKAKKLQDLIAALLGRVRDRLFLHSRPPWFAINVELEWIMMPKCTKRIYMMYRSRCQSRGSLFKRLLM